MKMQMQLTIDGKVIKFRRSLGDWIHNFNEYGEHGRNYTVRFIRPRARGEQWRIWRPLGQEPIAVSRSLFDAYRIAKDHWERTLLDGAPELRLKRFQPAKVEWI